MRSLLEAKIVQTPINSIKFAKTDLAKMPIIFNQKPIYSRSRPSITMSILKVATQRKKHALSSIAKAEASETKPVRILITGGASCPDGIIQQVISKINAYFPKDQLRSMEAY